MKRKGRQTSSLIERQRLVDNARIYRTAKDAAQAMGISEGGFVRACIQAGIETPFQRKAREHQEICKYYGKESQLYTGRSLEYQYYVEKDRLPSEEKS